MLHSVPGRVVDTVRAVSQMFLWPARAAVVAVVRAKCYSTGGSFFYADEMYARGLLEEGGRKFSIRLHIDTHDKDSFDLVIK